ncbi:hypothetical protein Tco_1337872 [Tanacetum coccineum]
MSTLAENVLAAGAENRPPTLEKGGYDTWQCRMLLYIKGKEHGEMFLDSILHVLFQYKVVTFPANEAIGVAAVTRMQTFTDLTPKEKIRKEGDIKVANMIHRVLTNDMYTLLNHKRIAYDIWYRVKELMEGTELTKQEKESKLADEFDIFTLEKGEMIHSYSIRFVIGVKQLKKLHNISFGQLYAHLKQNEPDANKVRTMKARFPYPLALIANTYNPPPSYSSYKSTSLVVQIIQGRQAQGYGNAGRGRVTGNNGVVKIVGELNAIPPKVIRCYNCKAEGHYAKQYFQVDGLEGFDLDCEQLQLNVTSKMTKKVDAYDLEVDDAPTANAILMVKLSPVGSINGDDVGPSYDPDTLSESSTSEELVFATNTDVDFLNDSNVISDNPYLDNNENEVVQEMTSFAQNDVAILSLIENMQHVFTRCNMINLESKQVNEQLTIEFDRYRKQIKVLET